MRGAARLIAGIAAVFYLGVGLWAFAAPLSFFTDVGPYPPYNEHFIHDIGAFNLGLGAAAVAGLLFADTLVAVLTALAVASVMHEIAHITDRLLGGHPSDPYTLGGLAILVLAGLLAAARSVDRRRTTTAAAR
ncbi:MAG TPA: hypothetical protein VL595_10120 [Pseudonocardia sp.]|jgi:hypothetical protein|nr:hypothetical protein [Pseudonocardia sp.]